MRKAVAICKNTQNIAVTRNISTEALVTIVQKQLMSILNDYDQLNYLLKGFLIHFITTTDSGSKNKKLIGSKNEQGRSSLES